MNAGYGQLPPYHDMQGGIAQAAGLIITVASFLGAPFTGGAMNPARALGPALAANHWSNHAVYWIGPLAGGVIAAWVADLIFMGTPKER